MNKRRRFKAKRRRAAARLERIGANEAAAYARGEVSYWEIGDRAVALLLQRSAARFEPLA